MDPRKNGKFGITVEKDMELDYEVVKATDLTREEFDLLVDIGYASVEPEQPHDRAFFQYWVSRMVHRPGTVVVFYYTHDVPVACYTIVDVSYGNAYNAECWKKYMMENDLPDGRKIWGVMEYRYVLPEYKGNGIATTIMKNHISIMAKHTPYTYIFLPSQGYGSEAAKKTTEKYYEKNCECTLASFDEFTVKYVKI